MHFFLHSSSLYYKVVSRDPKISTNGCRTLTILTDNTFLKVSASGNLMEDAKRDLQDIGFEAFSDHILPCTNIIESKVKEELPPLGILFSTYTALISRKEQIIEWLGEDFEGCLIFDESHKAKGLKLDSDSKINTDNSSSKLAVKDIQDRLKSARVVWSTVVQQAPQQFRT